jgi:hypothetical protein
MNAFKTMSLGALLATMLGPAVGEETVPAWQTPGYVMEEIVVTAKAPASAEELTRFLEAPELYLGEPVVIAQVQARVTQLLAFHARYAGLELPVANLF